MYISKYDNENSAVSIGKLSGQVMSDFRKKTTFKKIISSYEEDHNNPAHTYLSGSHQRPEKNQTWSIS